MMVPAGIKVKPPKNILKMMDELDQEIEREQKENKNNVR